MRSAIVWGGVGFLAGAAFWHAVGFWAFVSNVVLNGAAGTYGEGVRAQAPAALVAQSSDMRLPTVYLIDPANCTALALDRPSNRTEQTPCPDGGLALRLEPGSEREDLAVLTAAQTLQSVGFRAD